jgi:hypothetical protein
MAERLQFNKWLEKYSLTIAERIQFNKWLKEYSLTNG